MRSIRVVACALALLGGACSAEATATDVELRGISFSPRMLELDVGSVVTWTNADDVDLHTVTSGTPQEQGIPGIEEGALSDPDGMFDHDFTAVGQQFSFTFDEPGLFVYFCEVHAGMTGTVVVKG